MATPPGSPPTKSSGSRWSARMGGALRRTATVLTAVRPTTPGPAEDGDNRSVRRSSSTASLGSIGTPAIPAAVATPSPIAESPAREQAAVEQDILGPSPLARQTTTAEEVTSSPVEINPPAPVEEQTSPTGYVPPPLIDSSAGNPGAFTDELDRIPQPRTVVDPHLVPDIPDVPEPAPEPAPEPVPEQPQFFDKAMAESMKSAESLTLPSGPAAQETPAAAPQGSAAPEPGFSTAVMPSYGLPNYNVWASGSSQNVDKGLMPVPVAMPVAVAPSHHSRASSVKLPNPHVGPYEDPFADPPRHSGAPLQPQVAAPYQPDVVENQGDAYPPIVMPLPAFNEVVGQRGAAASRQSLGESRSHVEPETNERIPLLARSPPNGYSKPTSVANLVSVSPLGGPSTGWATSNTQSRLIDLGWIEYNLPDGTTYYSHMSKKLTTDLNLRSERILNAVTLWMEERETESYGIDMEGWLKEGADKTAKKKKSGWGRKNKTEDLVYLERYWVDHHRRTVSKDGEVIGYGRNHSYANGHGHGHIGKGKKQAHTSRVAEEDRLDSEYRYWAFMEDHPAHLPVSHKAKTEALDVLTWSLADRLLPSQRAVPPPFTQEECMELRGILKSYNENDHNDNGIQTRIIARILLRVAQWRQVYFRPNKPLPQDIDKGRTLPIQKRPFRRAFFEFVISCIFLGIPYFFLERARLAGTRTSDEESGLLRGPAPMLIVGACTCLMAAIVLSASVTFLSLPGLDGITRTAAMVAVLFAAFAMASTGVAVLRHKVELERPVSHVGVEGVVGISRRTIVLSLPLVFLAYAIVAFISGITLYSFRGKSGDSTRGNPFDDYTRWIVVGVLGGLAGVLTTSTLLLRH